MKNHSFSGEQGSLHQDVVLNHRSEMEALKARYEVGDVSLYRPAEVEDPEAWFHDTINAYQDEYLTEKMDLDLMQDSNWHHIRYSLSHRYQVAYDNRVRENAIRIQVLRFANAWSKHLDVVERVDRYRDSDLAKEDIEASEKKNITEFEERLRRSGIDAEEVLFQASEMGLLSNYDHRLSEIKDRVIVNEYDVDRYANLTDNHAAGVSRRALPFKQVSELKAGSPSESSIEANLAKINYHETYLRLVI